MQGREKAPEWVLKVFSFNPPFEIVGDLSVCLIAFSRGRRCP